MVDNNVFIVCRSHLLGEALESILNKSGLTTKYIAGYLPELKNLAEIHENDVIVWLVEPIGEDPALAAQVAAIGRLTQKLPATRLIVLGLGYPMEQQSAGLREIGAAALLPLDIGTSTFVGAIELICLGQKIYPAGEASYWPVLIEVDVGQIAAPATTHPTPSPGRQPAVASVADSDLRSRPAINTVVDLGEPGPSVSLSGREKEILQMLVKGFSNKRIARQLNIAEATVKVHVKGLLRKTNASNRTQAAVWGLGHALEAGQIENRV